MIDQNTDFFAYVNNFAKKEGIESICIFDKYIGKPLVTIGIPTFKRISTLKDALESALSQDCSFSYKVMVLDNNPDREDETEVFMKKYEDNPVVSYYKNSKNLGMGGNWNRIVTLSQSEWVVMLHDDDLIATSFLSDMMKVAVKYNADVVNSSFLFWYEEKGECPKFNFNKEEYKIIQSSLAANFFYNRAGMPTGILWRRSTFIEEGGVNEDYYPSLDWIFNARVSYKHKFLLYQKELTIYRLAINASTKKEALEAYIPINYHFLYYMGKILHFPKWMVDFYVKIEIGNYTNRLGLEYYQLFGKKIRALKRKSIYLRSYIIKASLWYLNWKYYVGKI